MARQSEKYSLEEKQKKGRGIKRKQDWNGDEVTAVVKRRGIDTPSPISLLSRPNSVTSSLLNDNNNIDVVNDDSDSNSTGLLIVTDQNTSGRNTPDTLKPPPVKMSSTTNGKGKTTAAGKLVRTKKKGGSAAAAAGAMAGKLAASQAAFAAYGVPYNHLLSSSNLLAVPSPVASSNPPSNHSSPRASPVPAYSTVNHTP